MTGTERGSELPPSKHSTVLLLRIWLVQLRFSWLPMGRMSAQPDIKLQIKQQTEEPMLVSRTHAHTHRARFVSKAPGGKLQAGNEP